MVEYFSARNNFLRQILVASFSFFPFLSGPPDAPSIINITVYGKSCFLQWETPYNGESSIQAYTISVWILKGNKNEEKSKKWQRQWNTTKTNHNIDLKWGVNYTIAVSAWNKYGQSLYGIEEHFSTGMFNPGMNVESESEEHPCFKRYQTGFGYIDRLERNFVVMVV